MKKALEAVGLALAGALFMVAAGSAQQPPPDPKTIFEAAQQALAAHDYPKAEQGFREVLKIDPQSAAAYSNLGVVYIREGKYDAAIGAFTHAKKLPPQMPGLDLNLGLAYYYKHDFASAIGAFERVLRFDPEHAQARYLLGLSYFMRDDFERTVRTLSPLMTSEKNNLDYLFVMGIAYGKSQQEEESPQAFAQLVEAGGETAHMRLLLGQAYLDLFWNAKAETELEHAVALDPEAAVRSLQPRCGLRAGREIGPGRRGVQAGNAGLAPGALEL